jgi:hypothetical protein
MTLIANPATEHASRYLQQLCKHWSHKFEVSFTPEAGEIVLPLGTVELKAEADQLEITLRPLDGADLEKFKQVIEEHLDRFAHKEAPLEYSWRAAD